MGDIGWQFPVILFGAFMLTAVMSVLQMRRYNRALQEALAWSSGKNDMLLSGRYRSFRGGAMVVLVVDRAKREIVRADAMTGYTVFARFKPRPELIGSVAQAKERAGSRALREGVANALLQLPPASVPRKVAPAAPTAKPKPRATGAGA